MISLRPLWMISVIIVSVIKAQYVYPNFIAHKEKKNIERIDSIHFDD